MENRKQFRGDSLGTLQFFTQFRDVIFRCEGSVLPKIAIELSISFSLGVLAYILFHHPHWLNLRGVAMLPSEMNVSSSAETGAGGVRADGDSMWADNLEWDVSFDGHSLLGLLLGFLTVFRTQTGFQFYLEGQEHMTAMSKTLRNIAIEILGAIPENGATPEQARLTCTYVHTMDAYKYVRLHAWMRRRYSHACMCISRRGSPKRQPQRHTPATGFPPLSTSSPPHPTSLPTTYLPRFHLSLLTSHLPPLTCHLPPPTSHHIPSCPSSDVRGSSTNPNPHPNPNHAQGKAHTVHHPT